jgi:hypothetical protein
MHAWWHYCACVFYRQYRDVASLRCYLCYPLLLKLRHPCWLQPCWRHPRRHVLVCVYPMRFNFGDAHVGSMSGSPWCSRSLCCHSLVCILCVSVRMCAAQRVFRHMWHPFWPPNANPMCKHALLPPARPYDFTYEGVHATCVVPQFASLPWPVVCDVGLCSQHGCHIRQKMVYTG